MLITSSKNVSGFDIYWLTQKNNNNNNKLIFMSSFIQITPSTFKGIPSDIETSILYVVFAQLPPLLLLFHAIVVHVVLTVNSSLKFGCWIYNTVVFLLQFTNGTAESPPTFLQNNISWNHTNRIAICCGSCLKFVQAV